MRIRWFGQSAYLLSGEGASVLVDPFGDPGIATQRGLQFDYPPIEGVTADLVLVTHEHFDNNAAEVVGGEPDGRPASPTVCSAHVTTRPSSCSRPRHGREWEKTRIEPAVRSSAKAAITARLSPAIAVALLMCQIACRPVLSPRSP